MLILVRWWSEEKGKDEECFHFLVLKDEIAFERCYSGETYGIIRVIWNLSRKKRRFHRVIKETPIRNSDRPWKQNESLMKEIQKTPQGVKWRCGWGKVLMFGELSARLDGNISCSFNWRMCQLGKSEITRVKLCVGSEKGNGEKMKSGANSNLLDSFFKPEVFDVPSKTRDFARYLQVTRRTPPRRAPINSLLAGAQFCTKESEGLPA
jgi:hypothetical protein